MKNSLIIFLLFCGIYNVSHAQANNNSSTHANRLEAIMVKFKDRLMYPLIQGGITTGVLPVKNMANKIASNQKINLIFDFTQVTANTLQGSHINEGLDEVARTINLHIAAGVKKQHLKTAIIFHSGALLTVQNDAYYQKMFGNTNPNNQMLQQLLAIGTELIVCGQSMQFSGYEAKDLAPNVQMSFSAKTTLAKYQTLDYVVFNIKE